MKTGRKHERSIEDLGDDIRVMPGFGFYLRPSYCSLSTCKAQCVGLLGIKRTRAGETRQGRLRRFDEAIARFLDGIEIAIFFEVFMVPRPLALAGAMRSRTCADVIQPCLQWQERCQKTFISRIFIPQSSTLTDVRITYTGQ